jgi:hypothetical protein
LTRRGADPVPDPFGEKPIRLHRRSLQLMGARIRIESNSPRLLRLVDHAFAGLPAHKFGPASPRLNIRLNLAAGLSRKLRATPPSVKMFAGEGLLGGAMDESNLAIIDPARRSALVVVSRDMLQHPYHVRYELIEFAVYLLAARVQRLVPLHAAAVGINGRGVLLIGASQAGKSTMALHCLLGGLHLLSEDAVFVAPQGLLATGVANFVHVQADGLRFIQDDKSARWIRRSPVITRRSGAEKFEVNLRASGHSLAKKPLKIEAVVFLSRRLAGAHPLLVPLPKRKLRQRLSAQQAYAARQEGWRCFGAELADVRAFELRRGSHPREAVQALHELLDPSARRAPHT